ncbi:RHS repeat domain-containing protein [Mariniflexile ostreae]|uniref:RHS repeat domain-containing protein n=1 Tax=Mariniflexile ostreae TaxID=1520892 RepID=A0ABV5FDJ8_9FLAO
MPGPPVQFGPPVKPETVKPAEGFTGIGLPENDIFYFHPDHLGSTSYITTQNGSISQHVEYIAFGEILFEEHSSSFSTPYLFNGKELDRETNLSYYGARYLDMKTSLWLSVDPLAENYPNMGSYIYTMQNPINLIDPTGMASEDPPTEEELNNIGVDVSNMVDGYNWTDNDGSWNYNRQSETWVGQGNTDYNVKARTEKLDEVVVTASRKNSTSLFGNMLNTASDLWNSPSARMTVPDKISLSFSSSATAIIGKSTDFSLNWITRGHDAQFTPYGILTVGMQGGTKVSGDALINFNAGYYTTTDMRNLQIGQARDGLLGWSAYGSVDGGLGLGGSITGSVGFQDLPFISRPTWISGGVGIGASIGGGATGGVSYSWPIVSSQFKK